MLTIPSLKFLLGGNQTTQQTKPASDGSPAPQGGSQAALNIFRPQMYYDFEAYLSSRYSDLLRQP